MKNDVIVFDVSGEGHRRNYVCFLSSILSARGLIGDWRRHLASLLWERSIFFSTFESAPAVFSIVTVVRALLGKRTALIILRPAITGRGMTQKVKVFVHRILTMLPRTRVIVVTPLPRGSHLEGRVHFLKDPEFWDLDPAATRGSTDLAEEIGTAAAGRDILMFAGGISEDKGAGYLAELMTQAQFSDLHLLVVVAGKVSLDAQASIALIQKRGGFVVDRLLTDDELFSLYAQSRFSWCCYAPERDMSSGIFGRSLQLGVWPIVRRNSLLDQVRQSYGFGSSINWKNASDAVAAIAEIVVIDQKTTIGREQEIERLKNIISQN